MFIKQAVFIKSSPAWQECPTENYPEVALVGRSNVGKSSLINYLMQRKKLAKIANTPGKTQLINHFLINQAWYLVDLPGYGFAKAPVHVKKEWTKMVRAYLVHRKNLSYIGVLIAANLPPQAIDLAFIEWLGQQHLSFILIFTKSDKVAKQRLEDNISAFKTTLLQTWENLPPCFITSTHHQQGRQALLDYQNTILQQHHAIVIKPGLV